MMPFLNLTRPFSFSNRRPGDPSPGLGVEVIHIGEGAGGKEVLADVANRSLHAPLLVAARHGHGTRLKAVVAGKGQILGVEANGVAYTLQHGALEVVAQDDAWHTTPGFKGQEVAAKKAVHARGQTEVQEDAPRVRQRHHKAHQGSLGAAYAQMAKVRRVHLGLLGGKGVQAQIGLRRPPWVRSGHKVAIVRNPKFKPQQLWKRPSGLFHDWFLGQSSSRKKTPLTVRKERFLAVVHMCSSIEPGDSPAKHLDGQFMMFQIDPVDIGDLKLAAG